MGEFMGEFYTATDDRKVALILDQASAMGE